MHSLPSIWDHPAWCFFGQLRHTQTDPASCELAVYIYKKDAKRNKPVRTGQGPWSDQEIQH